MKKLTPIIKNEIIYKAKSGLSNVKNSKKLGINEKSVRRVLSKVNLNIDKNQLEDQICLMKGNSDQ